MTISTDSMSPAFGEAHAMPLAPLMPRLLAALVDGAVTWIVLLPFAVLVFGSVGFLLGHVPVSDEVGRIKLTLAAWMVHPLVNGYLLAKRGQTVGKWCFGLRIVRSDGRPASLRRLLLLRWLLVGLASLLPGIGAWMYLVDPVLVFGRSRQCLHDLLADTIVVRARP